MLNYWASNSLLLCWAFLLPCIINLIIAGVCCYIDGSRLSYLMPVAVVSGVVTQIAVLGLLAKLSLVAMTMEVTIYDQVVRAAYFLIGAGMFIRSLCILANILGSWGDDTDNDDDDDEPEPEPPTPVGPRTGLTLQTCSSHRLQSN